MRHRLGNGQPHCKDCFWYEENKQNGTKFLDGWCKNEYERTHGINGRKREPRDVAVRWMWNCSQWEDAEDRLTKYEVMTGRVEDWRNGLDRDRVEEILRPYNERVEAVLGRPRSWKEARDGQVDIVDL